MKKLRRRLYTASCTGSVLHPRGRRASISFSTIVVDQNWPGGAMEGWVQRPLEFAVPGLPKGWGAECQGKAFGRQRRQIGSLDRCFGQRAHAAHDSTCPGAAPDPAFGMQRPAGGAPTLSPCPARRYNRPSVTSRPRSTSDGPHWREPGVSLPRIASPAPAQALSSYFHSNDI